jgi:hypothetical protein
MCNITTSRAMDDVSRTERQTPSTIHIQYPPRKRKTSQSILIRFNSTLSFVKFSYYYDNNGNAAVAVE